jgi:hypothetical protein
MVVVRLELAEAAGRMLVPDNRLKRMWLETVTRINVRYH